MAMIGRCTVNQLEMFLRQYNERFLWELEGQEQEFAALPLELDELIMYIPRFFSDSYPDIYFFDCNQNQDNEDTNYEPSVEIITNVDDIDKYVVYDGKHSDFLVIGFSKCKEEAYTLLALPIEDYIISDEDD